MTRMDAEVRETDEAKGWYLSESFWCTLEHVVYTVCTFSPSASRVRGSVTADTRPVKALCISHHRFMTLYDGSVCARSSKLLV